ncbi:PIG-L deacetylase family protein [Leekyejoonella antrihumi]|uniref:PIG-L family deacetylase n=1 Tax=Leekyejoonella antrihumi TaxID=1660198 RepID=A0A563E4M2_9MICO|nr:PIG-L deacetylase family protein [Leekyejoonella antrihumi]TWP36824.1 PIG-L family deacetylase [Leekyejoonella antrihumi]
MIDTLPQDRSARVLVVVAHPDDETFGTGSLLLHLAAAGVTTAVCCASRGEAGEVREGVTVPPGGLAALREAELREAADLLGVSEIHLLDLVDSGMTGAAPSDSVTGVPLRELVRRLSQVVLGFRPDALVTLDGRDGHRDHLRVRDAAERVGQDLGIPTWLHCLPRRLMREWAQLLAGRDPHSPYLALGELGTPDETITMRIDTSSHYERRAQAIALHRSQTSPYEALPEELRRAFLAAEHMVAPTGRTQASPHGARDPESMGHHHTRSGCYWVHLEGRWSCALVSVTPAVR